MRERVQLIRVSHPTLGPYEADLTRLDQSDQETYTVYLPVNDQDTPLQVGERLVLKWALGQQKRGRGVVEEVHTDELEGHDLSWQTYRVSVQIQDHASNLRHYPRMIAGFEFFYAPLLEIEEGEEWLTVTSSLDNLRADPRLSHPIDNLLDFSVSGLSFEAKKPVDSSSPLLCAIGIGYPAQLIRCLSKVVRCEPEEDHYAIAIHFISPPVELAQALSDYTLRLQRKETEG